MGIAAQEWVVRPADQVYSLLADNLPLRPLQAKTDTVVAVIGLALAMQVRRRLGTLDVRDLSTLRR